VKAYWLPVGFGAGIALGIFIARPGGDPPVQAVDPPAATRVASQISAPVQVPATALSPPPARIPATLPPVASEAEVAETPAERQPIDPGPVFTKQFAEAEKAGFKNAMAEQHAVLEREARDDSWAYPMEAEIQNSMLADVSAGNFKMDHLECRASMCEVQLSAQGEQQQAALRKWNDGLHTTPVSSQLLMTSGSFISDDVATNALIIFQKPPPPPAPKH
jgi:hypothetical protein